MRLHRNAKTTPLMRQLIVDRVMRQHWTQARAAEAAGVSVRTVTKWVARWRAGDLACLDAASRPHRQPRRLAVATVSQIVQLRQTRATAWQISTALQVPRSTVTRVLRQAGLNRLRVLEPRPVIRRYEWPHAGDLLHVDIKPLGRIRGIGHRMTGDRQRPQPGSGWEYVHVAIDDATRLAYVEVRRSQRRHACARFLRRALQWFARRGIRVHRVLTDNCSAPGFLDSGLKVITSTLPRPVRRNRVALGLDSDSRTSPASTARCTSVETRARRGGVPRSFRSSAPTRDSPLPCG